jgi:peptidoglycan/LPS O-acetylase OafA/YrhL
MTDTLTLAGSRDDGYVRTATTPIFLGSYRLLLAFLVFCAHAVWPLAQSVTQAEIGPIAVMCFFIVSGFLITLTIEVHYAHSVRGYVVNRFLRIYPTFWASMLVAVASLLLMGTTYFSANFYIRGWTWDNIIRCILIFPALGGNETWGPIPVGWTLQVEVSFYLVMALLYLAIGRLPQKTRHMLIMCFCSACFGGYVVLVATTTLAWTNALLFIPFFGAGVVTAIISRLESGQHAMRLFGGIVLAAALALCIKFLFFMLPQTPGYVMGTAVTFPIVCGLFFFLLLPPIASRLARFKKIDTFLGDLTYPVYTLHFPLNQLTSFWLYGYLGPSTVFVQLAVTILAAYAVLQFVDRPLSATRRRVREESTAIGQGRAKLAGVGARFAPAILYVRENILGSLAKAYLRRRSAL